MSEQSDELYELSKELVEGMGYALIDVVEVRAGGQRIFRFYVDQPKGIGLSDCAAVSREISYLLDAEVETDGGYSLEVSSPGTDHELKKEREYKHFMGRKARLVLRSDAEDVRVVVGTLKGVDSGSVTIDSDDGEELTIPLSAIARGHLVE